MIISERIFEILKTKGISQKDFSKMTGISQSTISDWKTKKTNPAADKIMAICEVLNLTPGELLSGAEGAALKKPDYIMVDMQSEEYYLIERYRGLDQESRSRLAGYLQALEGR